MTIQCLDDRKADGVDLLEHSLNRCVTTSRVIAELPEHALEAIVGPASIITHLDAEVAKLGENRPRAGIEPASIVRHELTVASGDESVNVQFRIRRR